MEITVKGFSKKTAAELTLAARFYADLLLDPRVVRNIVLEIERDKNSTDLGSCVNEDDTRNPRWFTINIRGARGDADPVQTLAHEMVHLKQYAKNELKSGFKVPSRGGMKMKSKWKGEIWKPKGKEHEYFDSPWEIEAYGKEVGLYHRWVEFHYGTKG